MIRNKLITLLLLTAFVAASAPGKYPADSLLTSPSTGIVKKAVVLPIALWQRISYNLPGLGCQFYPSCSNYGALAIKEYGIPAGLAVTGDRITRCNPFAWHYHLELGGEFHKPDGRLVDPIIPTAGSYTDSKKSPLLAAALSTIIPGSGRIYAGRTADGLLGLLTFGLTFSSALSGYKNDQPVEGGIFLGIAAIFYTGEIYGAWRSAKYYQPPAKRW